MAAKETFQLTENDVKEVLYMSDVDPNEACVYHLLNGEVLVVLFKMFESDTRDFVSEYSTQSIMGLSYALASLHFYLRKSTYTRNIFSKTITCKS